MLSQLTKDIPLLLHTQVVDVAVQNGILLGDTLLYTLALILQHYYYM